MSQIYIALNETAHGKRFWCAGNDPDTLKLKHPDRTLKILGPAVLRDEHDPEGYDDESDAVVVLAYLAGVDLEAPETWDNATSSAEL